MQILKMVTKNCYFQWIIALGFLLLGGAVSSKNHVYVAVHHLTGNQANDLVDMINKNRTSKRLPQLNNSPGLACIALQYIKECRANCSQNNTVNCKPPENDFTEIFAPNCGIELPTFGTISGLIVGCQQRHLDPAEAFSNILIHDNATLSLIHNKTHNEVGVGIIRAKRHKGPYFWCAFFSNNEKNTTFVLEDLGKGIEQKEGCYSGTSIPCSFGGQNGNFVSLWTLIFCFLVIGSGTGFV